MRHLAAVVSIALLTLVQASQGGPALVSVRVEGEGYLRLLRDGRVVYAREARLVADRGRLGTERGCALLPTIAAPPGATIQIDAAGNVVASVAGRTTPLGRIHLALFDAPLAGPGKDGLYTSPSRPDLRWPGEQGAGTIAQAAVRVYPSDASAKAAPVVPVRPPKVAPAGQQPPVRPPVAPTGQPAINIRTASEVQGDRFTFGEIADIVADRATAERLAATVAGDTPALGVDRVLDHARLAARLRTAGFEPLRLSINLPSGAKVVRRGQRATQEQFVAAAIVGANAKLGVLGELASKQPGPDLVLPLGELQLVCESVTESDQGVRATVAAYVAGRRIQSRVVQLERTGVGPTLKIGQTVKVRLRSAGAMIETTARVSRSGKRGEPVEVLTSDGVTLSGMATPEGVVEVTL